VADGFVPCALLTIGSCPATDDFGDAFGSFADAGADQRVTGGGNGSGPGASLASCSPSPCTKGSAVSHTVSVADADSNPQTVTRTFHIERPTNLTGNAPLFVLPGTAGDADAAILEKYSPTGRYEMLFVDPTLHSGQPSIPTIGSTTLLASYPYRNCGTTGTEVCDDIPYLKAAIDWAISNTAVDTDRIYIGGGSKSGSFSEDAICDDRTYSYFTGAVIASIGVNSNSYSNAQSVAPICPELLGTSNGVGGSAGLSPNTNVSIMWAYGTNDGTGCGTSVPNCFDIGQTWGNGQWMFSYSQLAGDSSPTSPATSTGANVAFGHKLGCGGTPSTDTTYGTGNLLRKRIYTGCTNPSRAMETLRVSTGGHAFNGLDGVGGLDLAAEIWNFLSTYGG
jgi:poly(3-hydroxybutyrate) depolymerase